MTRLLSIASSPAGEQSKSSALVKRFVDALQAHSPNVDIASRDLGAAPPPHIDAEMIGSYYTPEDQRSEDQLAAIRLSDDLVEELMAADVIVIGAPMHNFGISSSLKTWIDHVARVGRSFRYTENGPEGLIKGKKVYVITANGGNYSEGHPAHSMDHQTPYLKTVLGFLGLDDVTFIHAFGVSGGEDGLRAAEAEIDGVIANEFSVQAA